MTTQGPASAGKSWDTYWQGTGDVSAFCGGGSNHPAIHGFWSEFFASLKASQSLPKMIDLATGNGTVVDIAIEVLGIDSANVTCVDLSPTAIENVKQRIPGVTGVVADALQIPLADGDFGLVTSQFGVEYAGVDAIYEGARLLATGGELVMLLHVENGGVFNECKKSLSAIERLRDAKFIPYANELFKTGFAALHGADRAPYDAAGRQLAPAVQTAEDIISEYGEHVAGDTILNLYNDIGRIHAELPKYDRQEILAWLETMDNELDAFAERMLSMTSVALNQETLESVCRNLIAGGLTVQRAEPLIPQGRQHAVAWVLRATRD